MEWIAGFVAGFLVDLSRSVFLPATTDWLNKYIPSARKKANVAENALTLEIMSKLKELGKDPALAKHSRDEVGTFTAIVTSQKEAFVNHQVEVVDSTYMTQGEMNEEAVRRADVAERQMKQARIALEKSGLMNEAQLAALERAQDRWQEFARARADVVAAAFEGGTMAPLIWWSEMEAATISRAGELSLLLDDLRKQEG